MKRRTTSRDVAAHAGVSQSTVSYVLTGRPGIKEDTRERVLKAIDALNYRPNLAARSMRTRRTGRLAVVMQLAIPRIAEVLDGAATVAREAGYVLEIQGLPGGQRAREERLLEIAESGEFEGLLSFTDLPRTTAYGSDRTTVVLALNEYDENLRVTGELLDAAPLVEMIEGLAASGYRRFMHVTGELNYASARLRRDVFESTVDRLGLESLGVVEGDWGGACGERAIRDLAADAPPVAVIAASDLIATGAIRGAYSRGWTIPGDVAITGWDDLSTSAFQVPSITTVVQDRHELGAHATRRLLAAMRGEPDPGHARPLQRVVWRESTGAPAPTT